MAANPKTIEATGRVFATFRDAHGIEGDDAWKLIDRALGAFLMERTGRIDSEFQHMPPGARLGAVIDGYGVEVVSDALERFARGDLTLPAPTRDNELRGWGVIDAAGRSKGFGSPQGAIRAFLNASLDDGMRVYHDGQVVIDRDAEFDQQLLFADSEAQRLFDVVSAEVGADEKRRLGRTVGHEPGVEQEPDSIRFVIVDKEDPDVAEDAIVGIPDVASNRAPTSTTAPISDGRDVVDAIGKGPDIDLGSDSGAGQEGAKGKSLGPHSLQNGRFERDEAGQYRRVGEEKISLVDEGLRIRMLDKQEDAFLASIELAAAKGWKTIEVTGSPKFRAEAWLNAKLAGFEVIGYTPMEIDLVSLESAREGKGVVATPEALAKSKAAAEAVAKVKCAKVADADTEKGRYAGPVLLVTEHHVVQDIGRKTAVVHELKKLPKAEVERALTGKRNLSVEYQAGIVFAKTRAPLARAQER